MSFVERSIILCPYLGGSTIGGSTVFSARNRRVYFVEMSFLCIQIPYYIPYISVDEMV